MECNNPGRSNKDRAAKHIIEDMIKKKGISVDELGKIKDRNKYTIYEGTSGNTGISLGLLASYYGISAKIFLNNNLSETKVRASNKVSSYGGHWL